MKGLTRVALAVGLCAVALTLYACPVGVEGLACPCGDGAFECCEGICVEAGTCGPACDFEGSGPWCEVRVERNRSCGLTKWGELECWGNDIPTPAGKNIRGIDMASGATCLIDADRSVSCLPSLGTPAAVETQQVAASTVRRCVTDPLMQMHCWAVAALYEIELDGPVFVREISANDLDTCAVLNDSSLRCWGEFTTDTPTGEFTALSVGAQSACAIDVQSKAVVCWGLSPPVPPTAENGGFLSVATGRNWACAIDSDGALACFGLAADADKPWIADVPAPGSAVFRQAAAYDNHACAVTTDDAIVCWGDNSEGQLDVPDVAAP